MHLLESRQRRQSRLLLRHGAIEMRLHLLHDAAGVDTRRESQARVVAARHHGGVILIVGDLGHAGRQADLDLPGTAAMLGGGKGGHHVLHLR